MNPKGGNDPWGDIQPPKDSQNIDLDDLLRLLRKSDVNWSKLVGGAGLAYIVFKILDSASESVDDRQSFSRLARAAAKLEDKQYNVFISHSWSYDEDYNGIIELLENVPSLTWQNHSVPEQKQLDTKTDAELEQALRSRMKNASIVLTSAGMYGSDSYSKWIPREHQIADELDKPIVAVKPEGQKNIPNYVEDYAYKIVGWTRASIVEALASHA